MNKDEIIELANHAHVLRSRIRTTERKLATAYPDQRANLERDLERTRAMLAETEPEVEGAIERVREELLAACESYFTSRFRLARLLGYMNDPGFADTIFAKVALGAEPAQDALSVKAALMKVVEMEPATDTQVPDVQRIHDERLRNDRAGRGYFTDAELQRQAEDPIGFVYGAGAREVRPRVSTGGSDA